MDDHIITTNTRLQWNNYFLIDIKNICNFPQCKNREQVVELFTLVVWLLNIIWNDVWLPKIADEKLNFLLKL